MIKLWDTLFRHGAVPSDADKHDITREYLVTIRDYCQGRIDAGDLDFDDWVYRSRDAVNVLLENFFQEESEDG